MKDIEQLVFTTLHEKFHLRSLYPYQELVIRTILERGGLFGPQAAASSKSEQIVVLPTGSGKSVCFMLPALLLPGITIIVYPLLSLMNDQGRRIEEAGAEAIILRGGQTNQEREALCCRLENDKVKFIITNPETMKNPSVIKRLQKMKISLIVIDEVHTVTQWGDTFRPSYLELGEILKILDPPQITAFTATASQRIISRISDILFSGRTAHIVKGDPDRPNISYRVLPSLCKIHELQMLVSYSIELPAVVFCSSRKRCETFAWKLKERLASLSVRYYHAGLDKKEREATERWFFHAKQALLISTSAYGMGVDKKNIRTVIHLDISSDVESFLQESGRAGRDGNQAYSIVLVGREDSDRARTLGNEAPYTNLLQLFKQHTFCRRQALLQLMGFPNDSCSGCDVCNQKVVTVADGEEEIERLCTRFPLRFTLETSSHLLKGSRSLRSCAFIDRQNPYFGILGKWEIEDITAAIQSMIKSGRINVCKFVLCKGKLFK
jgi:ATP-dependent DNA helicase RecQ